MGKVVGIRERKERIFTPAHEVRDLKGGGFFQVSDEFFDGYAKGLGTACTLVYMALCRYAGGDQTCFPSVELIGDKLGISTATVSRGLKELERRKVIKVSRVKGKSNIYTLLSNKVWGRELAVAEPEKIFEGFVGMCGSCGSAEEGCGSCIGGIHWVEKEAMVSG
jgi:hypothetical protein